MQVKKLVRFKKHSKLIRINKLYFDLLKTKHLLRFFVGGIKQHQLTNFYKVVATKSRFTQFLQRIECRLEFILLISGFALTGQQARQLILHQNVQVNGSWIKAYNYQVKLLDLISIQNRIIRQYKSDLISNFFKTPTFFLFLRKKKHIIKKVSLRQIYSYFKFPSFLEINYKTCTLSVVRLPISHEFFFPKILSLYDCNQLYFLL